MSAASPTAFALWAVLSVLFLVFLVHHLWCYDRFKCLRRSAGQTGAFKRIMTYTYLCAVPLLTVYSVGMTVIKFREGFIPLHPDGSGTILPLPINLYREPNRSLVLPLQFVFSMAWALEMVTHLEELAFWLYLLHQNPEKEAWFSSWEYRLWYMGSLVAIVAMPMTTLITRRNLETCDAYIILVGASGSTMTTLAFLYVLWRFPLFIKHVKAEGADPTVVVRLATFYQLNQVRVVFRFMFTIPLLIVAIDGIVGTTHSINRNLFAVDFLQIIAGLGCFVSSMITLLIFFPRSIVREAGYKPKISSTVGPNSPKTPPVTPPSRPGSFAPHPHGATPQYYHPFPPHMAGYVTQNAMRMSVTGGTGTGWTTTGVTGASTWEMEGSAYTHSMYSPRQSLYDSPQYPTDEDGGAPERRGSRASRLSRRGSRRVSVMGGRPMDAHLEQDSDAESEGERERDREDEERAPPYSHPHPHAHPDPHEISPPTEAHLHHRQPFTHSSSNPHIMTLSHGQPAPGTHKSPEMPPPLHRTSSPEASPPRSLSPSSTSKPQIWDWEERRPPPTLVHEARRSLHVITTAPGVNLGLGIMGTALGPLGPRGSGAAGAAAGASAGAGTGAMAGRGSSLHPYVVNFTSPIDLVDLPPREELPRAV